MEGCPHCGAARKALRHVGDEVKCTSCGAWTRDAGRSDTEAPTRGADPPSGPVVEPPRQDKGLGWVEQLDELVEGVVTTVAAAWDSLGAALGVPVDGGRIRSGRSAYENRCWRCHTPISSLKHSRCPACGWYRCGECGACAKDCHCPPASVEERRATSPSAVSDYQLETLQADLETAGMRIPAAQYLAEVDDEDSIFTGDPAIDAMILHHYDLDD